MQNNIVNLDALENSLRERLTAGQTVRLADTPDFPLAFNVRFPENVPCPNGHLGVRFTDFTANGVESARLEHARSTVSADQAVVSLHWDRIQLAGRYAITVKPAPVIMLDTGGNMLDFDESDIRPAGASSQPPLDPATRDAMIINAQNQRTRLQDDPNGQQLLAQFNEHNEIYNTVFIKSAAARATWTQNAGGATKDMMLHTHETVGSSPGSTPVNPSDKLFGTGQVTYNANAFIQHVNIVTNTVASDPSFNAWDPNAKPDPNSPYTKAALAALTFQTAVGQTGNTKSQTTPLTSNAVYGQVKTGTTPSDATVDQLTNFLQQGTQSGGAAAAVAESRQWHVLDEEDRRLVRFHLFAAAKQRIEEAQVQTETLWSGACEADFSGAEARLEFTVEGGRWKVASVTVELPAFEFELDDSAWIGPAADIARERLAEVSFIRSLLRERIEAGLTDHLTVAAQSVCDHV